MNSTDKGVPTVPPIRQTLMLYSVAAVLVFATFLLRQNLPISLEERPMLILYMFPIIVSALLGGLGPGLTATLAAAACTAFAIPPADRFAMTADHDIIQWGMLMINGILVSLLSEYIHRLRRRETLRWRQLDTTQDRLRQSETRFQSTFEQAAVGMALVAPDGHWLRVNRKLCEIVGYSPEELLAGQFQDITHPDDLNADVEQMRRTLSGEIESYSMEKRYIRKDGSPVWINLTAALALKPDARPDYFIAAIEDIQARKQAELALRDSEQRFRRLFLMAPVPMAFVSQDSVVVAINDRFADTFGYTHADIPTLAVWWPLAYPDADYRRSVMHSWNAAVESAMAQNTDILPMEYRITCKDGGMRRVVISGIMIGNDFLVTLVDVTERRNAEDALRARERYQRAVLDNFPFMVWLKDGDSRILAANKAFAEVANVADPDELVGNTDFDYWDAELAERYRAEDRAVLESGLPKAVEVEINKAGRRLWLETYKSPVELDGRIIGTVGFARDITRRKQSELALCESEARFRALVEQSLAGIYIIQDERFRYVNPGFAVIFGYDAPEAIIERVAVADLVSPEDRERVAENLRRRIDGEITNIRYIFRGLKKDGSCIAIEAHGRAFDFQGKAAVIGFILDITARKSAEDALFRQADELARRNAELERFNRATVGRELDMIALKQQVNALSRQLGQAPPYPLSFLETSAAQQPERKPL